MILIYFIYLYQTIKTEVNSEFKGEDLKENLDPFLLSRFIPSLKPTIPLISLQLIISLFCFIHLSINIMDDT